MARGGGGVLFRFGQVSVWTGFFSFGEEQTTKTIIDRRVMISGASSVSQQMIGGYRPMQIN